MRLLDSQLGLDCLGGEGNLATLGEIDSLESDDMQQSSLLLSRDSVLISITAQVEAAGAQVGNRLQVASDQRNRDVRVAALP